MNHEITLKAFGYWVLAGMGLTVGFGLIKIIVAVLAKAVGHEGPAL